MSTIELINLSDRNRRRRQEKIFIDVDGLDLFLFVPENLVLFSVQGPYVATFCHRAAVFLSQKSSHSAKPRHSIHKRIMEPFTPAFYMCAYPSRRTCSIRPVAIKAQRPRQRLLPHFLACACISERACTYSAASARAGTRKQHVHLSCRAKGHRSMGRHNYSHNGS